MNGMKRALPIDELLSWAYLEIRKTPNWGGPSMFNNSVWELGTRVDHSGQYEAVDLNGCPHKDAHRLAEHVSRLPTHTINWARDQGWLLGGLQAYLKVDDLVEMGLITMPRARRNGKISNARVSRQMVTTNLEPTSRLVIRYASMGRIPEWDTPKLQPVRTLDNHIAEDGPLITIEDKKTRTHCPLELDPCAAQAALSRWNYRRWVMALEQLVLDVNDLEEYTPVAAGFDRTPWFSQITQSRNSDSRVPQELARALVVQISTEQHLLTLVK